MKFQNTIKDLNKNGFSIIKNCLNKNYCKKLINSLEEICSKNENKKFIEVINGQLIVRDLIFRNFKIFSKIIEFPIIMKILEKVFRDEFIIDNILASNSIIRKKNENESRIHMDGHLPVKQFKNTTDMVAIICLNDFKKKNGSTNVWPGSHLSGIKINDDQKKNNKYKKKFKSLETEAGSIIFIPGQTWHQIGKNISGDKRWAIIIHYKLWWIKPGLNYSLCGKKIFNSLNNRQKKLFGFTSIVQRINLTNMSRINSKTKRKVQSVPKNYQRAIAY